VAERQIWAGKSPSAQRLAVGGISTLPTEATPESESDKWRNAARWTAEHNEM
jgi:hypothetical protein